MTDDHCDRHELRGFRRARMPRSALGEVKYIQREPRYRDRCTNDPEIGPDVHHRAMMSFGAYLWQSRCIGGTNSLTRVRGPFFLSDCFKDEREIEKDLIKRELGRH
jgi:hypothetical protein